MNLQKQKIFTLFVLLFLSFVRFSRAEEGMLIPSLLKAFESDMQAMGMKLSAEDLYSVNESSLKDAIFQFGGGCTAEVVSEKGLLLTNHHCGYSQIQFHSSLENDYLKNGFWAKTLEEELPNPGLTALRIVRIVDVTGLVLKGTQSKSDLATIESNIKSILEKERNGNEYEADIKAFDYGNQYFMMVKEVFRDIRFVGTPPNSIGKFGGDTDNWVWPRHTGDFSVFRIYANKENKPSEYSKENVPYKPLSHLKISMKNRQEGDFTLVYGFPGTTEQHMPSEYIRFIVEEERPARIHMRDLSLEVINNAMKSSDLTRIQYASKQARIANAWKKWIGQIEGLSSLGAVQIKLDREKEYEAKAKTKTSWKKYGNIVDSMNLLVRENKKFEFDYAMAVEYFYVGPEYFKLARAVNDILNNYEKYKTEKTLDSKVEELIKGAELFFKNYNPEVDADIFYQQTSAYQPTEKRDIKKISAKIYAKSFLTDKQRYLSFLQSLKKKVSSKYTKDPGIMYYNALYAEFIKNVIPGYRAYKTKMEELLQVYVEGLNTMFPDKKKWPDANSTLRITYGKLEGSSPVDGMAYTNHTTLKGIIDKNRTGNPDFEIDEKMKTLYNTQNYGTYSQDGELWVCFSGSNHTTGGNSGSPVLDAEGCLMGLNFDRSWESTMSDYLFDASRCRNIVVDIRYVLWVMDVYSGAGHLVEEMSLVR